jgi:predicted ArsR family transcriptional regulator
MDRVGAARRALADDNRVRLVEELQDASEADAERLASCIGVHVNTARWHLGVLRDAGLVESRREQRSVPGRPRILYRLCARQPEAAGDEHRPEPAADEHRLLAAMLAAALAGTDDPAARAEEAGRAWGRALDAGSVVDDVDGEGAGEAAAERMAELLDQHGFDATRVGLDIHMRRCPFHELAETHPQVVCAAHRGLAAGMLESLDAPLRVDGLDVLVRPGRCVLRLARSDCPRGTGPGV